MIIRTPLNQNEYADYYLLRWQVLRAPWGQIKGSEKDELENESIHRIAILNKEIVAVGRLHFIEKNSAQIRYMAVSEKYKNQGVGKAILLSLEKEANENNVHNILLHARETAIAFYQKQGYKLIKRSHLLFDEIQHFEMIKEPS